MVLWTPRPRRKVIVFSVAGAALLVACSKVSVADGEDCAENSNCKSGLCVTFGPGANDVCVKGGGSGIFSSGSATTCKPTCAHCPPTTKCPSDTKPEDTKYSSR
jgi:hypothetical protein